MTTSSASSSTTNLPSIAYIINTLYSDSNGSDVTLNGNGGTPNLMDKIKAIKDLTELIKAGNRPECKWNENFQKILHCLFKNLDAPPTSNENSPEMVKIQLVLFYFLENSLTYRVIKNN